MFRAAVQKSELKIRPRLYGCLLSAFLQICSFGDRLLGVLINRQDPADCFRVLVQNTHNLPLSFAGRETLTVLGEAP